MKLNFFLPLANVPLVNVRLVTVGFFVAFGLAGWACTQNPDFELKKQTNEPLTILENATVDEIQTHLASFKGEKPVLVNIWATWCLPCREEMPSLDLLQSNFKLDNLKIFPINIGQEDLSKSVTFFDELKIENLNIYYDPAVTLVKKFSLRGLPTTILFDKEGKEFARIIGSIDFSNKEFIDWLSSYN